ncbi:MAG TPA: hypothetical protein VI757_12805 [Bacteroidia bacterium]|nr:hypothetical protein [Bacteroidia bacterium]
MGHRGHHNKSDSLCAEAVPENIFNDSVGMLPVRGTSVRKYERVAKETY